MKGNLIRPPRRFCRSASCGRNLLERKQKGRPIAIPGVFLVRYLDAGASPFRIADAVVSSGPVAGGVQKYNRKEG